MIISKFFKNVLLISVSSLILTCVPVTTVHATGIKHGIYEIRSRINNDYTFDVAGPSLDNGASLQLWENCDVENQKFEVRSDGDGFYVIKSVYSGKVLDTDGHDIYQYKEAGKDSQKWKIEPSSAKGYYYLINKATNLYADVDNAVADCGVNIKMFVKNDAYEAQKFAFKLIESLDSSNSKKKVEDSKESFQMTVISELMSAPFAGEFLNQDGVIYVSDSTLEKMSDIDCALRIGDPNCTYELSRLGYTCKLSATDIVTNENSNYYPLGKVSNQLGLFLGFDAGNRCIVVQQCKDLTKLEELTYSIFRDDLYDIGSWRDDFLYEAGYNYAVVLDTVKNMDFATDSSRDEEMKIYNEIVWETILPSSEDEMLNFSKETDSTLSTVNEYIDYADDMSLLHFNDKGGLLGDWGEVISIFADVSDYLQTDELLSAIEYAHGLKNVDESYMNGLATVLNDNKNVSKVWRNSIDRVHTSYKNHEDVWKIASREFISGASHDIRDKGEEFIVRYFNEALFAAIRATSFSVNLVFDTQNQIDATIKAHKCLELQDVCRAYKNRNFQCVSKSFTKIDQNRLDKIRDFRDVLALYLRFGVTAYKAFELKSDPELTQACEVAIGRINSTLEQLMSYSENDFSYIENNTNVISSLAKYVDNH